MANPNPRRDHLKPWVKGQSGNPAGRKPGQISISARVKKLLAEDKPPQVLIDAIREKLGEDRPAIDAMIIVAAVRALEGDPTFFKALAEHGWGKPGASIDLTHKGDQQAPVTFTVKIDNS